MNGSANSLLDKEEHPLQLGESFERRPKASFHTIRCERRPLYFPPAAAAPSFPRLPLPASRPPTACPGGASPYAVPTGEPPLSSDPFPRPAPGRGGNTCPAPRHPHRGFLPGSHRGFLLVKGRPLPAGRRGLPARHHEAFTSPVFLTASFVPSPQGFVPSRRLLSPPLSHPSSSPSTPPQRPSSLPRVFSPQKCPTPAGSVRGGGGRWMPAESAWRGGRFEGGGGRFEAGRPGRGTKDLGKFFMKRA